MVGGRAGVDEGVSPQLGDVGAVAGCFAVYMVAEFGASAKGGRCSTLSLDPLRERGHHARARE
jgi:hypothetical protein